MPDAKARLEAAIEAFDSGDKSRKLFDEFISLIDAGYAEANYFVACMYEDGTNGVSKNLEYAYFYYQQSAESGYVEGYLAVARFNYWGHGIPRDFDLAYRYYSQILELKNPTAPYFILGVAYFMLGRMYQYGEGVKKDIEAARAWYGKSITQGSVYGMINFAILETQEGNLIKGLYLRIKAVVCSVLIARKDLRDPRLRHG